MALSALVALPLSHDKQDLQDEVAAEHSWLRKLFGSPPEAKARAALRARLATLITESAAPVVRDAVPATRANLIKEHAAFVAWVTAKRPDAVQSDDAPVTAEAFLAQLGAVPWQKGNSRRGEDLLRQRACLGCHGGSAPIGPALAGVGKRMSRDDLLTAILDPSRDVSSLYAATTYDTRSGESVTGLISYEADVIMLRTGATTMVRLSAGDVLSRRPADSSLMPSGLLDGLGAQNIADLFAHLQSLQ